MTRTSLFKASKYAATSTKLKPDDIVLAKVNATIENELANEYDVQGFPTVILGFLNSLVVSFQMLFASWIYLAIDILHI